MYSDNDYEVIDILKLLLNYDIAVIILKHKTDNIINIPGNVMTHQ